MDLDWWQELISQNYDWFLSVSIALVATLLAVFVWGLVRGRLVSLTNKTTNNWDNLVLETITPPINWTILLVGLTWAVDITAAHFVEEKIASISIARQLGMIVLLAWALWRLVTRFEAQQLESGRDATTVQLVGKISKMVISVLILLPVFQLLGISISGILAFGGMGGLIVGMAAKDLLANIFGSVIIYMDKPFKVGDWIRSPDRSIEGVVEHIGFRVTCIRTFDKRPLYVPNAVFTSISVENPSRMSNRRIYETIGIRYQDAHLVKDLMNRVRTMLETHPDIDQNQALIVHFNAFGASSLDFFIYTLTKTTDWFEYHKVKEDVLLKIMDIIHDVGADCAFPNSNS